jgi:AraC-like DNA-binding protein
MSRITLYRKIKAISNLTPVELINITRLKKAAELLAEGEYKIYEVADMVGFSSQSNFARNFNKQFNMTPTDYMHSKQTEKKKI